MCGTRVCASSSSSPLLLVMYGPCFPTCVNHLRDRRKYVGGGAFFIYVLFQAGKEGLFLFFLLSLRNGRGGSRIWECACLSRNNIPHSLHGPSEKIRRSVVFLVLPPTPKKDIFCAIVKKPASSQMLPQVMYFLAMILEKVAWSKLRCRRDNTIPINYRENPSRSSRLDSSKRAIIIQGLLLQPPPRCLRRLKLSNPNSISSLFPSN